MRVALLRHGQTDWNVQRRYQGFDGVDLNETGRAQAQEAGERLKHLRLGRPGEAGPHWSWLASSTSPRAITTAKIIGQELGLDLTTRDPDLRERGFGAAEGMGIDDARAKWPNRAYPGGESVTQTRERVLRGLARVTAAHCDANGGGADGVIVTHGTSLRLIVWEVTGTDPGSLVNVALALLDGDPSGWRLALAPEPSEWQSDLR
ncbi:MAG: histidine phosphatase family protein [Promicromonosporaceae bacterium]|nr:histidine phosphatase family protein [Promicromonosporaceae bacterium]